MTIEVGTKVIIKPYAEYRDKYRGFVGIVEKAHNKTSVGVAFPNITNKASSYGLFWFSVENITIVENEEDFQMLKTHITAGVKFLDGSNQDTEYLYALYNENIVVGDIVVVKTGHHGFALAEVASVNEYDERFPVKCGREIVNKVDFTDYNERCERVKRLGELKGKLESKVKEYQQNAIYEMVAEKDPSMRAFLDEYKELLGL